MEDGFSDNYQEKKRRGRPSKAQDDRALYVHLSLKPTQMQKFRAYADAHKLKPTQVLAHLLASSGNEGFQQVMQCRQELQEVVRLLRTSGTNINQVARRLNAGTPLLLSEKFHFEQSLKNHTALLERLKKILS